jgi:hypothetical protein
MIRPFLIFQKGAFFLQDFAFEIYHQIEMPAIK